jgi:hypothetical protein
MCDPRVRRRLLSALAAVAIACVVLGCAQKISTVSGRVLVDGKPLPGGRVTFRPENTAFNSVSVDLDEQGRYQATLPLGKISVSVDNRELAPRPAVRSMSPDALPADLRSKLGAAPRQAAPEVRQSSRYVKIPDRYYTSDSGELDFTVESAGQQHDIELKSN